MPPVRTSRNRKPPPAGFDDIEDTLLEFSNKMKDAENAPHEGKKKHEVLWPIFQISHQRTQALPYPYSQSKLTSAGTGSRYIYDLYYEKEAISKQLYDWLLKNNYADANLIAKWKKQGYEKVRRRWLKESALPCVTNNVSSFAACAVYRRRRRILMPHASAACPRPSSKRIK
jgi:hypothetical protein